MGEDAKKQVRNPKKQLSFIHCTDCTIIWHCCFDRSRVAWSLSLSRRSNFPCYCDGCERFSICHRAYAKRASLPTDECANDLAYKYRKVI